MNRPKICAAIVDNNLAAIKGVEPFVELFEVRIDLIGDSWTEVAQKLNKPWIACNRLAEEGGGWEKSETSRLEELLKAPELGAEIVDIELRTQNLGESLKLIKKRAKCLLSSHDLSGTPSLDSLIEIVQMQVAAGADICKIVTTAKDFNDNLTVMQLINEFPKEKVVSFAMGPLGFTSRVLCPLTGGYFTYASIEGGRESASGQITVKELRQLYEMVQQ